MPDLLIRIKKKADGDAALSCVRADGSVTWQRQEGQLGRFFPLHDLTHYAVETVLGFDSAFYGLVASGWNISDFSMEGTKYRLPLEAHIAEMVVNHFDLERIVGGIGSVGSADDLNERIRVQFEDQKLPPTDFRINARELDEIRARRAELFARWHALPDGEALELPFERHARAAAPDTKSAVRA